MNKITSNYHRATDQRWFRSHALSYSGRFVPGNETAYSNIRALERLSEPIQPNEEKE